MTASESDSPAGASPGVSQPTLGVLFLRRKRAGFDPDWGEKMEQQVRRQLDASAFGVVVPEGRIVDDASLREALAACISAGCDVLIALQTTMSDGRLSAVLGQIWDGPVVLWATPEKPDSDRVSACSLVGTHVFAATLRQLGRPFELVYGMPEHDETVAELEQAVRIAHTVRRLGRGRAALVGSHAPGFIDMHADPFLLNSELGVQLHHVSLDELMTRMRDCEEAEVAADAEAIRTLELPMHDVDESDLEPGSRFYLAVHRLLCEEHLDSIAVREWPELSDEIGHWPYLAMARLSSEGLAVGCEGDVDGAITCWIGTTLGCGVGYLTDWLEHDADTMTLWHGGSAPFQLCEPVGSRLGPTVGVHFNNGKPAVVDACLKVDLPITLVRLWHCDGRYRMAAFNARTQEPQRPQKGTCGVARLEGRDIRDLFDTLCHAGMPHHLAVFAGHHVDRIRRLVAQTRIDWFE